MDASILTTLGSVVILLGGMLTIASHLKKDIQAVKADLQGDIHRVEADIRRADDRTWQLSVLVIKHLGVPPDVLPPGPERQPTDSDQVNA